MKIKLVGKKVPVESEEFAEMKVGRGNLTEVQTEGIGALSDEAYWALHDWLDDKDEVFHTYVGIIMCLSKTNAPLAMDLICNLLVDNEMDDIVSKVKAFIPKEDEHVTYFVNHFAGNFILEMIDAEDEEEWNDMNDEDDFVIEADIPCEGCFGASFEDCCKCGHKGRDSHE